MSHHLPIDHTRAGPPPSGRGPRGSGLPSDQQQPDPHFYSDDDDLGAARGAIVALALTGGFALLVYVGYAIVRWLAA